MRRIVIYVLLFSLFPASAWADETYGVWFGPNDASPDLIDLFRQPQRWSRARSQVNVFIFVPELLTQLTAVKRNSFEELKGVDAFGKLHAWGLKIASEEGAIKEWDCTGMQAAKGTELRIRNVHAAGSAIDIIAMDEPLRSGRRRCGLSAVETARRTAAYVRAVDSSDETKAAGVIPVIGDVEPYPSFSVIDIKEWIDDLKAAGFRPAFVHIDVNVGFVDVHPEINIKNDLRSLQVFFRQKGIPFGIILWSGYDPLNSDRAYYDHVMRLVHEVKEAVGRPDQVIFQSWVMRSPQGCQESDKFCASQPCSRTDPSYCGERSIPINLPESDPASFAHTRLINDALTALGTSSFSPLPPSHVSVD
jgi:hypothetical protein